MDKLPRKEDLLKGQGSPKKEPTLPAGENPEVRKSKDDAEIASQNLKRMEAELKAKLMQNDFKTLDDGLADAKRKNDEADKILEYAHQKEQEIATATTKMEQDKQTIVNAYAKVKRTEELVNARLEQAIKLEKVRQSEIDNHNAKIEELNYLVQYHEDNIKPCRKALLDVSYAIYTWADTLTQARVDFTNLYNDVGRTMKRIDRYLDTIPQNITLPEPTKEQKNDEGNGQKRLDNV